jgi:hypothetical protein
LTWESSDPTGTVEAKQRHYSPPALLPSTELVKAYELYGDKIVQWCYARMGQQVGNGECWTLADEALKAVGEQTNPPCMPSQSLVHGHIVYEHVHGHSPVWADDIIRAGDIVQWLSAKYERRERGRIVYGSSVGAPDHTAVVTKYSDGVILVLHQNTGGAKVVKTGEFRFAEMVGGEIRIYRPIWKNWAGELKPTW